MFYEGGWKAKKLLSNNYFLKRAENMSENMFDNTC